ncbi:unnamed protein product [Cyprideis torosa]|uniref:Eukaryotic translation initiation factor 2 subunit 2 n=1 Tax=Cyprideis torosa TaxID=163714 RepID=A0A7R8WIK6_9CRUS|nr:unnamed protein product [Cyprideis torosa]CAG0894227.1 unnamed protein product [Cyprideis torosa]
MSAEGEQELLFDPNMKKKKKKKTGFDLDAALREDSSLPCDDAASTPSTGDKVDAEAIPTIQAFGEEAVAADGGLDVDLDLTKMKKKKKTKKFTEEDYEGETDKGKAETGDFDDLELDLTSKKKKKKPKGKLLDQDESPSGDVPGTDRDYDAIDESRGIDFSALSDRDYTYEELLKRAFAIMREKNPEMVAGEKKKFIMKPPQVVKIGAKKTSFANFTEICKMLHRQQKHVLQFLFAELGTQGSVDGNNMLIIKGRFSQKQIENVLRRYIKEYVTCHTCRSPETILEKDTRLFFLRCESCGSRCSVASIKSGYQAVTGKRAAQRAKTA